ncbi:MAG: peptide ABC transporter substrate-binding protein [Acidobacteriota bacterium]|nr:peptide ABC transporter substrate-binding protein [Blastocatellia bacterium]MDW8411113.1 peptide ABC transporter substrate-binding protein [Acidobacteriota bacterium]
MQRLTLTLLLFVAACADKSEYFGSTTPPATQELRFWNAAEPRSLDPHKTGGIPEFYIITSIFESLTCYDPKTLEPIPGVAERWEAVDGARKWIFYLRRNAVWTDGRPVTAHDFVYAWRRAASPQTASPYVGLMFYVKNGEQISLGELSPTELGVIAQDDYTLVVEMQRPTAFFPKMTSHHIFAPLPSHAMDNLLANYGEKWTAVENIITNGPFKLVEHKPYDQVVVVKNPLYWDSATVQLERIVFIHTEDTATGLNLYKAGEVYTMQSGSIPLAFIKALKQKKDYVSGQLFFTYYYSINIQRKPLDDLRVRKALSMAIDRQAITDKLIGKGDIPAYSFVPPGVAGYKGYRGEGFNPERARQLLAEAGFPNGKGFPKLTIYFNTSDAQRQIAEAVQRMWKEHLGILVDLQNEEWQTFQARWERRDFDFSRDGWQGDYIDPNTFLDLMGADTPNNHSGWISEDYRRLLDAANSEADETKRMDLLARAEEMLMQAQPIIPIYFYSMSYLKKPFVEGWYPNLADVHPLKFVYIKQNWKEGS